MTIYFDMTQPDPVHEAAYIRILKVLRGNVAFVDAILAATPAMVQGNWKLSLVKASRDVTALRGLWARSAEFRDYLRGRLAYHYGAEKTEKLVTVFLL